MVQGTPLEPQPIFDKIRSPIWGVFSVTCRGKDEEAEGKGTIDAAIANGVQCFVFTSADRGGPSKSDRDPTPVPHLVSKYNIEKYLIAKAGKTSGEMQWTILRPVAFMENIGPDFTGKMTTRIMQQMGDVRLQMISVKDIGQTAAFIFNNPSRYRSQSLTLASEKLTYEEMNAIFKQEVGHDCPIAPSLLLSFVLLMVGDVRKMATWFNGGGYNGAIEKADHDLPSPMDFRTWLRTSSRWEVK